MRVGLGVHQALGEACEEPTLWNPSSGQCCEFPMGRGLIHTMRTVGTPKSERTHLGVA